MSLWDELTPEQKETALAYRGPENIGVLSRLQYVSLLAQKDRVIERQHEEIAQLVEQLSIRSESGMAKDMQDIMRDNNELLAVNNELSVAFQERDEALAENARLRGQKEGWKGLQAGTSDIVKQLEAENARLRAALKPFADLYNPDENVYLDMRLDAGFNPGIVVPMKDLRAARAAMGETE